MKKETRLFFWNCRMKLQITWNWNLDDTNVTSVCNLLNCFFFKTLMLLINPKLWDLASSVLKLVNETLVITSGGDSLARDVVKMLRTVITWEGTLRTIGPSAHVMNGLWEAEDGKAGLDGHLWPFPCSWDLSTTSMGSWSKWPGNHMDPVAVCLSTVTTERTGEYLCLGKG